MSNNLYGASFVEVPRCVSHYETILYGEARSPWLGTRKLDKRLRNMTYPGESLRPKTYRDLKLSPIPEE